MGQARAHPSVRPVHPLSRRLKRGGFVHLFRRFAAVAGVAQALQIIPVREHVPVPLVVPDVVHVCGPDPQSSGGTGPAEGLLQQLLCAQLTPRLRAVHPAPGRRPGAALSSLWLVGRAEAPGDQDVAPGSPARSQWPSAHGLSPPQAKQKEPEPTRSAFCGTCGSGSMAQAQIDVQILLPLASPAIREPPHTSVGWKADQPHHSALWTQHPTVCSVFHQ